MPTPVTASTSSQVTSALRRAGAKTGADFDFLLKMAQRESSLNPNAKAKTSSAAGLFQFIEQTWLGAVKQYGARHGLENFASDISRGENGKFMVANAARREEILNLRFNPNASAALAGELASENQSYLEGRLGRAAKAADLYTAHFLGPAGAVKLLSAASAVRAADILPSAAAANKNVFFDGARAKSVGEVVASIAVSMGGKSDSVSIPTTSKAVSENTIHAQAAALLETKQAEPGHAGIAKTVYGNVQNITALSNHIETSPSHQFTGATAVTEAPRRTASRLMAMALDVLQSLDPTGLMKARDTDRR